MSVRRLSPVAAGALAALATVVALTLAGPAGAQAPAPVISAQPALFPAFDAAVPDYVVRCTSGPRVTVNVSAPSGTRVNVDGQGPREGSFTTSVLLGAGQAFRITVTSGATSAFHFVRCLPSDLPRWTFSRFGQPQSEWFTAAPLAKTNFDPPPPGVSANYTFIFDRNGVPVWWKKATLQQTDFLVFPNGNVAWLRGGDAGGEERRLDGSLVRTVRPAGLAIDPHEFMLLPNGNYLITTIRTLPGKSYCSHTNRTIHDNGVQEVTPAGAVVWVWWASDHIALSEVPAMWCSAADANGVLDPYHINSAEPEGNDVLMSFRHLNAVYSVHKTNGAVEWKIGGTTRPESLAVHNDPVYGTDGFLGQHDVRDLADGTITLFDNGFGGTTPRQPRAVRYALDLNARTATLVEQKQYPSTTPLAVCCGSARRLSGGNWLMALGSTGIITELGPSGSRIFDLTWDDGLFSYRSHPVPSGVVSRPALRGGMDAQFPRGYVRPQAASPARFSLVPSYRQCVSPNRTHGSPLASGSCDPPTGASSFLTVGWNANQTESIGFVSYKVVAGNPSTPANEADVSLTLSLTDVRWKSNLADYGGQLQLRGSVRTTDRLNGSGQNESGTVLDTEFPVTVQCTATASASVGGSCSLSTTFNAIVPGSVIEGKRAIWQLGQVQVYDGGQSGTAGASDATLFETQGVFVP